ncbi:carotenoid oxygenase family protein [Sphaerisporangium perillae]|uniref:carotenoid oxygenase family protein n=1 Tax=Sphaerisporangium perillae TaxID=2935860 RepID=UPI0020103B31|nr:carotenoid oxygenase family protein [Sphaerisporangium perillae]
MTVAEHTDPIAAPGRLPHDEPPVVDGAIPPGLTGALVLTCAHPAGNAGLAPRSALLCGVRFGGGTARWLRAAGPGEGLPGRAAGAATWLRSAGPAIPGAPGGASVAPPAGDHIGAEWHTVASYPGLDVAEHLVIGPDGAVRDARPFALEGAPLMSAVALTERFVVVFDLPVTHHRAAAMLGSALPYRWRPGRPGRIGLLPRAAHDPSGPRWFPIDPCYVFEAVNAYDDRGRVVVDAVRHDRAFDTPSFDPGRDAGPARVHRWILDLASGTAAERLLIDTVEAASVDPRRAGRRHQLLFGRLAGKRAIAGRDLAAGTTQVREAGPGRRAGRPVFVPRDTGVEGDGWIMVFTRDLAQRRSELLVLDALNLTGPPQAVVHLPAALPAARHTAWLAAS